MKLRSEHLARHLSESPLEPVYLISGDVPLLVQDAVTAVRNKAKAEGYEERKTYVVDKQFDWQTLLNEADALSLFAERKLIELKFEKAKPGKDGSQALIKYCSRLPEDTVLSIVMPKVDAATQKSKWLSTLEASGVFMQIWPIEAPQLPKWIHARASILGLSLDDDAAHLLAERVQGNLLAAQQELEKLKLQLTGAKVSLSDVEQAVADSAKFDVFSLTDACLAQNPKKALSILSKLRAEASEPSIILWAITRDLRLLSELVQSQSNGQGTHAVLKKNRVIKKRQDGLVQLAAKHSHASLSQLLSLAKDIDDQIKGIKPHATVWDALSGLILALVDKQFIRFAQH